MFEKFSLNEVGRCSIVAVMSAYEYFNDHEMMTSEKKNLEKSCTKFGQFGHSRTRKGNFYAISSSISTITVNSEKLGMSIGKIGVNEQTKIALGNSDESYLSDSDVEKLSTSGVNPPFYAITGNGKSRHVEFLSTMEDFQKHVAEMQKSHGDDLEIIIEVRV